MQRLQSYEQLDTVAKYLGTGASIGTRALEPLAMTVSTLAFSSCTVWPLAASRLGRGLSIWKHKACYKKRYEATLDRELCSPWQEKASSETEAAISRIAQMA